MNGDWKEMNNIFELKNITFSFVKFGAVPPSSH